MEGREQAVPCGDVTRTLQRQWTYQTIMREGNAGLLTPFRASDEPDQFERLRVGAEHIRRSRVLLACKDTTANLVTKAAQNVLELRRQTEESNRLVERLRVQLELAEGCRDRAVTETTERLAIFLPLVAREAEKAISIEAAYLQGHAAAIFKQQQRDAKERERGERADANRRHAANVRSDHIERCAFAEFHPSNKDSQARSLQGP
jgi:hypothetical protein